MKKNVLSLALASVTALGFAQSENMEAFKHMSVGVEAGLMGAGVQVAMPVVSDHLVLVLGYNFMPEISYDLDLSFNTNGINNEIDKLNKEVQALNAMGKNYTMVTPLNGDEINATLNGTLKMNNFKALLEYYPSAKRSFHITAGLMIGNEDLISIAGMPDQTSRNTYKSALSLEKELKRDNVNIGDIDVKSSVAFNIDDKTYVLDDDASLDAAVTISKVKPYLGFGFGRAVPTKRVGFQFEIGAWMHGTPKISAIEAKTYLEDNSASIDGVGEIMSKITVYPQMTFRLTGRIF